MGIGWKESLAIGVEEIDNQHRELVRQFSRLLSACEEGKGEQEAREVLEFLEGYVRRHFSDEEALQRLHRYPAYHELQRASLLHDSHGSAPASGRR